MDDVLKVIVKQHQDDSYYADLLTQAQAQLTASEQAERRHETIARTMLEKQQSLEQALIDSWDDTAQFASLKAEYDSLQTVFTLAPKAYAYHQQRAHKLRQKQIVIKSQRDNAHVAREAAARAEKQEAERREQAAAARAETEARIAANKAKQDALNAEKQARIDQQTAEAEADKVSAVDWLKQITGKRGK